MTLRWVNISTRRNFFVGGNVSDIGYADPGNFAMQET